MLDHLASSVLLLCARMLGRPTKGGIPQGGIHLGRKPQSSIGLKVDSKRILEREWPPFYAGYSVVNTFARPCGTRPPLSSPADIGPSLPWAPLHLAKVLPLCLDGFQIHLAF